MSSILCDRRQHGQRPVPAGPAGPGRAGLRRRHETVCRVTERARPPLGWYVAFAVAAAWTGIFFVLIGYLIVTGIGVWGNNMPVRWAFAITNFVFWIGIGHAGTLISAILFCSGRSGGRASTASPRR